MTQTNSSSSTLYKKDKKGKLQQWTIELHNDSFRTIEGYVGGALTPTAYTVCLPVNEGKKNATTPQTQAIKEAAAKIAKQEKRGWAKTIEQIDGAKPKVSPMLAKKYDDYMDKIERQQKSSQPKLDGIRCVAVFGEGLFTRTGEKINSVPHIWEEVQKLYSQLSPFKGNLDGELYNHSLKNDFNKIASVVRKKNPSPDELKISEEIMKYHIYDFDMPGMPFHQRFQYIEIAMRMYQPTHIFSVKTTHTTGVTVGPESLPELDYLYNLYLEAGYEGQMVRLTDSLYEHKRSASLLKRKMGETEEFTIVDIVEGVGNRAGMTGNISFAEHGGFDANLRGDMAFKVELLKNKDQYIGKKATVWYQNITPTGKPRFPVMLHLRDDGI